MKYAISCLLPILLILFQHLPLQAQQGSHIVVRRQVVTMEDGDYVALAGQAIMEQLGIDSTEFPQFGAKVDSTYRRRSIGGMLELVSVLRKFEQQSGKQAKEINSVALLTIVDKMLIQRLQFEADIDLLRKCQNVHDEIGEPFSSELNSLLVQKDLLPIKDDVLATDTTVRVETDTVLTIVEVVEDTAAFSPPPPFGNGDNGQGNDNGNTGSESGSGYGTNLNAELILVNKTGEILYVYVNDMYKCRLYANQRREIKLEGGKCDDVYAETTSFDRLGKEVCIERHEAFEWIVEK
jgi:hypothetical protein